MEQELRKTYQEIEYLTALMDDQFSIFGFRIGLNFFIDLIPGIGDVATTLVAIYIFSLALKYKISNLAMMRMSLNIAVYFLLGLIPWIGDIFQSWWKPNRRNLNILKNQLSS